MTTRLQYVYLIQNNIKGTVAQIMRSQIAVENWKT